MKNKDTAQVLLDNFHLGRFDVVTCDSAEQKSIADYRSYGINARAAEKGPDSVRYGMKWLQSLIKIVIDPVRCPNTCEEFKKYEYELDKDGNPTSNYPDKDNHSIDMTRYAMEQVWKRRGR
jgi:phage terminase large subunit